MKKAAGEGDDSINLLLYIFECFKMLLPQKSFLLTVFTHIIPKCQHVPTVTQILHIILLHTMINMPESQMHIMFISLTIIKIKWVNKRGFFCQKYINDIY